MRIEKSLDPAGKSACATSASANPQLRTTVVAPVSPGVHCFPTRYNEAGPPPAGFVMSFVHLHCHTDYSLLDGACEIGQLMDLVVHQKMPAVAMTDHGNLFGAVEFYNKAKE